VDMLGLWVPELFAMYASNATDGQTDERTDKSNAYCSLSYGRGRNNQPISLKLGFMIEPAEQRSEEKQQI